MLNKKILLVDDNEDNLLLTQRLLVKKGYEIVTANSGLKAMKIFAQEKDVIFLVVLDVLMPDSDGRTLAVKMKAISPEIPIIFFSHYGYKDKLTKWGVEDIDYVMKHDEKKLITLIKKYEKKLPPESIP